MKVAPYMLFTSKRRIPTLILAIQSYIVMRRATISPVLGRLFKYWWERWRSAHCRAECWKVCWDISLSWRQITRSQRRRPASTIKRWPNPTQEEITTYIDKSQTHQYPPSKPSTTQSHLLTITTKLSNLLILIAPTAATTLATPVPQPVPEAQAARDTVQQLTNQTSTRCYLPLLQRRQHLLEPIH